MPFKAAPLRDNFEDKTLAFCWNYLCNPDSINYSLSARSGFLRLRCSTLTLDSPGSPTFVGRRQQHIRFQASTAIDVSGLTDGSEAGLTIYMSTRYHYDLSSRRTANGLQLVLTYNLGWLTHIEKMIPLQSSRIILQVTGTPDTYNFSYSDKGKDFTPLGTIDTRFLSTETAGGFTGIFLGLYAQGSTKNDSHADFDWFEYKPL
jgi:alpha-N-arabinofuranosidase